MPTLSKIAAELRKHALAYPETWEDTPWEHRVVKVRKKIFLFCDNDGNKSLRVTVKLPESSFEVLERANAEMTGYGLGKAGWVDLRYGPKDKVDVAELKAWIDESFKAVAPKSLHR